MKVSIIIPIYNVAAYIERCLLSVMSQSYQNIECILVDDASPDESVAIAQKCIAAYSGEILFRILSQEANQGVSEARNTGVCHAVGDYIYFLDPDDTLPPNSLNILAEAIMKTQASVALGAVEIKNGKEPSNLYPLQLEGYVTGKPIFSSYLRKEWYDMAWNKLINKSLFEEWTQPFERGIHPGEDSLFSFQLANKIQSLTVVPEITYCYYINPGSVMQQKTKQKIESIVAAIRGMINYSVQHHLFEAYPQLPTYFEQQRIYFFKSLLKGNFEKSYIQEQQTAINQLYQREVWQWQSRKIEFVVKDFVLLLWKKMKR